MGESEESKSAEHAEPTITGQSLRARIKAFALHARIKAIAPYALFLFLLVLVNNHWSTKVTQMLSRESQLQDDLRRCQDETADSKNQMEQIRSEFNSYREHNPARGQVLGSSITDNTETGTSGKDGRQVQVRVRPGNPATIWGDDLIISLIGTRIGSSPSKNRVSANVMSPGYTGMKIDAEVGSTVTYLGKDSFDIRIVTADKSSAKFSILRR